MPTNQNEIKNKGLTLVELIVVMLLLAALATTGLGSYLRSLQRARDSQRKADLAQVQRALEAYFNDRGKYPSSSSDGKIMGCGSAGTSVCDWGSYFGISETQPTYMQKLPVDPKTASGQTYVYQSSGGVDYRLYAKLENEDDPQIISTTVSCGTGVNCNYGVSSTNTSP